MTPAASSSGDHVQGTVAVDDGYLFYEEAGTGRAVVLLHAGLLDSSTWDAQFGLLKETHRVVRYDARGHGRSSTPTDDFAHHEDLGTLLREIDVRLPVLVGLSLGARTAVDFAIGNPGALAGLVLAAPGISGWEFSDPVTQARRRRMRSAEQAHDILEMAEQFVRAWVDGPIRSPQQVDPALRQRLKAMVVDNLQAHPQGQERVREIGAAGRLAEVTAPTLALVGELDSRDIHDIAVAIDKSAASAEYVAVPAAGHMVNLEAEATFNARLVTFLQDR